MDSSTDCFGVWSLGHTWKFMTHHWWRLSLASLVQFQDAWRYPDMHASILLAPSLCRLSACPDLQWESSRCCPDSCPVLMPSVCQWSLCTICLMHWMLTLVLDFEGLTLLGSSSMCSCPSLYLLHHSKTCEHDIVSSPYICCSNSACDEVSPNYTRNFKFVCCSVLIVWRPETEDIFIKLWRKMFDRPRELRLQLLTPGGLLWRKKSLDVKFGFKINLLWSIPELFWHTSYRSVVTGKRFTRRLWRGSKEIINLVFLKA